MTSDSTGTTSQGKKPTDDVKGFITYTLYQELSFDSPLLVDTTVTFPSMSGYQKSLTAHLSFDSEELGKMTAKELLLTCSIGMIRHLRTLCSAQKTSEGYDGTR